MVVCLGRSFFWFFILGLLSLFLVLFIVLDLASNKCFYVLLHPPISPSNQPYQVSRKKYRQPYQVFIPGQKF
jgi:hypothetical protein